MKVNPENISTVREKIKPYIVETPTLHHEYFSKITGNNVYLKLENLQHTGAFKVRGAASKFLSIPESDLKKGVVCASAGNHSQGVARIAQKLNIPAKVVMPIDSPIIKIENTKSYGAEVILKGNVWDEAYEHAVEISKKEGSTVIHPFKDEFIIYGQGTIAYEIAEAVKADQLVVSIGGGGLISGIAMAAKTINPDIKIIGVVAENAPSMAESIKAGKVVSCTVKPTLADGIAVKKASSEMVGLIDQWVDEIVTVSEIEMADAITSTLEKSKFLLEGAGSAPLAAILSGKCPKPNGAQVAVCSGGNIDLNTLSRVLETGLLTKGRVFNGRIQLLNKPGVLQELTEVLAEKRANILQVIHTRTSQSLSHNQIEVDLTVETGSFEHIDELKAALTEKGFEFSIKN
jgi:threonine dehydratase